MFFTTGFRRRTSLFSLTVCLLLMSAACSSSDSDAKDAASTSVSSSSSPSTTPVSPTSVVTTEPVSEKSLRSGESINWGTCGTAECSTVSVPVDYEDNDAGTIEIAVSVHRSVGDDADWLGYLFVNPGGPGGSGLDFAAGAADGGFTPAVLAHFDIVGFDPRGVGLSEPTFTCGDGSDFRSLTAQIDDFVDTDAEKTAGEALAALCGEAMGPVGNKLNSANVARDMDQIRAALGAEQINYYGASYGSVLGVWYATLFPDSVRAMVIDGADNPYQEVSENLDDRFISELEEVSEFENQLALAIAACDDNSCPIFNDGNPTEYLTLAAAKSDLVRDASSSGSETATILGIVTTLYSQDRWFELYDALYELVDNENAAPMAELAREQLGDVAGMTITTQVNCLDLWMIQPESAVFDPSGQRDDEELQRRLLAELPLAGQFDGDEFDPCPFMEDLAPKPLGRTLDGSDVPILVIGNTSDPATPYVESEELANDVLTNGFLVRVDHPSHVVYPGGGNTCVSEHVEAMLIEMTPPDEDGAECAREAAVELTIDDLPWLIEATCVDYGSEVLADADENAIGEACAPSVPAVLESLDADFVLSLFLGENDDGFAELLAVYDALYSDAGIN